MIIVNEPPVTLTSDEVEVWRGITPATVGHILEFVFMDPAIRPVWRPIKLVGLAFTVQSAAQDSAIVHYALDLVRPGDVVVLDRGGDVRHAAWGEMTTRAAQAKGVAGAISDGAMTDQHFIEELRFPAFSRTISALTTKTLGRDGAINIPVQVGGVVVRPGDLVMGDDDGVVVLSPAQARELASRCQEREDREEWMRQELASGRPISDISGADRLIREQLERQ